MFAVYVTPGEVAVAEIMTVKELAKYLKMKEVTIYRCAQEGRLPGIKIRGQWRFDKNRIDQMIEKSSSRTGERLLL